MRLDHSSHIQYGGVKCIRSRNDCGCIVLILIVRWYEPRRTYLSLILISNGGLCEKDVARDSLPGVFL